MKLNLRIPINYYFNNIKLQTKFLISHLLLVFIPAVVLLFFFYNEFSDLIVTNTIKSEQTLTEQTATTIEATLSQISNATTSLANHAFIKNLSHGEDVIDITEENFIDSLNTFVDGHFITDIKVYIQKEFENTDVFLPLDDAKGSYWHGIFSGTNNTRILCPSLYLSPEEISNYGELAMIEKITSSGDSPKAVAFIAVYFSKNNLDKLLEQHISIYNGVTYIINERNAMVSTSNSNLSGAYFMDYNDTLSLIGASNNFVLQTILGEDVYIGYHKIQNADWLLISVLPYNSLYEKGNSIALKFRIFYLIILALALIAALSLSRSIIKRLSSVIDQMNLVRLGNPPVELNHLQHSDEIGDLIDTYNYMTREINHLLSKNTEVAENLRLSEFRSLQKQINPHFLYNTLDMINWLSINGDKSQASNAIQTLSKFYKLTLNHKDSLGTIEKELEHVNLYVQLQNMRYQNSINFLVDIPDELLEYEVPILTFQPIIENSIQHGIFAREGKSGSIVITSWKEADTIVILFSDNGVGIDLLKINEILSRNSLKEEYTNIGTFNTHRRLQLFYGAHYGLTYSINSQKGTDVELRLPAKKGSFPN